jgi:hypothetical protein
MKQVRGESEAQVKLADQQHHRRKLQNTDLTYLHFGIGPSWNLDDHVQDGLLLIGIQGDVVEWRHRNTIFLDENAMLQGVRSSDLSGCVLGGHIREERVVGGGGRRARKVSSYLACARRNFVGGIGWRQCGCGSRERERLQLQTTRGGRVFVQVNIQLSCKY